MAVWAYGHSPAVRPSSRPTPMYDHSKSVAFLLLSSAMVTGEGLLAGERFSPLSMSESWLERTSWRQMKAEGL